MLSTNANIIKPKTSSKLNRTGILIGRSLCVLSLTTALCLGIPGTIHAQTVSLSTYPSTIQLRAQATETLRSKFTVENKSSDSIKLNIVLKPFKADAANDGKILYSEGNDPKLLKQVQVVDNGFAVSSIELGPKQSKQLDLRINLNKNEPISDYYFSVILLAEESTLKDDTPNEATAYSAAQAGIAVNVLLAVGPKEHPLGYLEEFSTPLYRDSGPVPFKVKVKNRGPHYFTPKGVILIRNMFGQTVGRLDIQNANILAGTSRSLISTPYTPNANGTQKNITKNTQENGPENINTLLAEPAAVWPEQFLLGFYTADLSITLSEEGPVFNQTIRFIAFPTKILIALGVLGIIILLLILRIRRKLKDS